MSLLDYGLGGGCLGMFCLDELLELLAPGGETYGLSALCLMFCYCSLYRCFCNCY